MKVEGEIAMRKLERVKCPTEDKKQDRNGNSVIMVFAFVFKLFTNCLETKNAKHGFFTRSRI